MKPRLRVAFLIGKEDAATQQVIRAVCELGEVVPLAVLLDTAEAGRAQRRRNLKRNVRREGLSYIPHRIVAAVLEKLEAMAEQVVPEGEVQALLAKAFPEAGLPAMAEQFGFPIFRAGNLNGPTAIEYLKGLDADLGIVLGTRILKRAIFAVPRQGCVNLHKGQVPEYRGMPPGFWELYDGAESAGVTVHFVDDGLDTGDVVGRSEVAIHPKETPESLRKKLDYEGVRLMAAAVREVASGTAVREPQGKTELGARTRPTRQQTLALGRKLPHWRVRRELREIVKHAVWLALFHGGVYGLVKRLHAGKSRGAILLYHRVNDISVDVLTASTKRFAQHLVTLRHYYRPTSTEAMVDALAEGKSLEATSVAVHFDDCYRDVRGCAAPLLAAAGVPGMAFVSSGFVNTERAFEHDRRKYPHAFENFRTQDLRELGAFGVAVAAHTVNHVDLGAVSLEQARMEVAESGKELERLTGRPVEVFSFPFGRVDNIREEVREMVIGSGYRALFSAHGGFVDEATPLFDIPRIGVSSDHSPLALMMELEGISAAGLREWIKGLFRGKTAAAERTAARA